MAGVGRVWLGEKVPVRRFCRIIAGPPESCDGGRRSPRSCKKFPKGLHQGLKWRQALADFGAGRLGFHPLRIGHLREDPGRRLDIRIPVRLEPELLDLTEQFQKMVHVDGLHEVCIGPQIVRAMDIRGFLG
jgi:hypothetical protein